jgi:membrane protease YdiL (CAAX protease family)
LELAIVALFNVSAIIVISQVVRWALGPEAAQTTVLQKATSEHVVTQLISTGNAWIFVFCAFSAVVAAPISEEFLFRVMFQGWLESVESHWRPKLKKWLRMAPVGFFPIGVTSFLFALMHYRKESAPVNDLSLYLMLGGSVAYLLTMAFAIFLLRRQVGATSFDLGWSREHVRGDILRGLAAFTAVAAPVYSIQFAAKYFFLHYLHTDVAPDPIPLFFFAISLGVLYFRTHRILPSIVLHVSLNATSLLLGLWQ